MKKLLLPIMSILLFVSCEKQISEESITGTPNNGNGNGNPGNGKVDICHREGNGSYHTINVSKSALPAHAGHGDIIPDADGDGYTRVNPCGLGSQDDCDDTRADVNPGATEVCLNSIDDNCNGQVDEGCIQIVNICNQTWTLRNLDVLKYRNGTIIPQATTLAQWIALGNAGTGAWCYYENMTANGIVYGKLYNWYAVNDSRGLAPLGWHIPSDLEWSILVQCLDNDVVAGGRMKKAGLAHWLTPNSGATNISGFTGLPGGYRLPIGVFNDIGAYGVFWSSTNDGLNSAWVRSLFNASSQLYRYSFDKEYGFSVRLIKN